MSLGAVVIVNRMAGRRIQQVEETSAGGLVLRQLAQDPSTGSGSPTPSRWQAALIARHDRRGRLVWSLPKGHLEGAETPTEAAIREVEEETGILGEIVAPLGVIDFWFVADGRRIHKTVHHFLLRAISGELSDADIEVAAVEWVDLDAVAHRLTYADERGLLDRVPDLVAELS